MYLYFQKMQL